MNGIEVKEISFNEWLVWAVRWRVVEFIHIKA